jgi:DNA-3-methyladenine glycosylase
LGETLPRSFYERATVEVARDLLGAVLIHGTAAGRIVEVEAYLSRGDEAAHSHHGRTPRTEVLFGPGGHAYVYLSYGIHHCLNVTAEAKGVAGCVLIRALEPLRGISKSASGPGRLTKALGIDLRHYGQDFTRGPLLIEAGAGQFEIGVSTRIGITKSADLPLRFFIQRNEFLSR